MKNLAYLDEATLKEMLRRSWKYSFRFKPVERIMTSAPKESPLVSVLIPTYNWSNVLRLAIRSVLWQTEQNFEIIVTGDACTDDSGEVVRSFGDTRIHWQNLATNSGSQSIPNNAGIARARGQYVAYLGHDDIWHPAHLRTLLRSIQRDQADVAASLVEMIGPPGSNYRVVLGFYESKQFEGEWALPPSGLLHRREIAEKAGGWKDYRTIRRNPDMDFVHRMWDAGFRFTSTRELTVFKFNSALRKNSYVDKPSFEQASYLGRIAKRRHFLWEEAREIVHVHRNRLPMSSLEFPPPPDPDAKGWYVTQYRKARGLE